MGILEFDIWSLFTWTNLFAIVLGALVGMFLGALPGLGISITLVLLFPLTLVLPPLASILLLLSAYQSAEYGGSISSITLGIPGNAAAAVSVLDGNPYAKKYSPGKALGFSLTSSTIGGIFGGLVLIFLTIPLAKFALRLADPEVFLVGILGLMGVAMLSSTSVVRSLISVVLGLLLGTVGYDLLDGTNRFTLGRLELMDGVKIVALLIGLFAFSEIFKMITGKKVEKSSKIVAEQFKTGLTWKEFKSVFKSTMAGAGIGSVVGILPGMGAAVASWFSYAIAKKMTKIPVKFGEGNPDGITGPESANNAAVGGSLVPLLSLGIPGSPAIAIVMGAFIIHGISPGPSVFSGNSDLIYGLFYGFLLTTVAMYILGRMITTFFARVVSIPIALLAPIILILCIVGIYAATGLMFHLWFALCVGIIAFVLRKLDYSLPSFILGFILCPIIEVSMRRSLDISRGDFTVFVTRPYSLPLLILIVLIIIYPLVKLLWKRYKKNKSGDLA